MKKTILLACFLLLFAGLKAQQAKSKNSDVTEHREGGNPAVKAQQKQVKKDTVQSQVQKVQTTYLRVDSAKSGTGAVHRDGVSAERQAAQVTQIKKSPAKRQKQVTDSSKEIKKANN
mgnify:CR=1 FL=1